MKTEILAQLPIDKAIEQLKEESTPKNKMEFDDSKRCEFRAGQRVLDDWGDTCKGMRCCMSKGHDGDHMSSDGANGWVYFGEEKTLEFEIEIGKKSQAEAVKKSLESKGVKFKQVDPKPERKSFWQKLWGK